MTNFEDKTCKVLGIILFILIITMWIQLSGCCGIPKKELFDDEPMPDYIDSVETSIYAIATIRISNRH